MGFCDLEGFHSSTMVLRFLESWGFRGFLRGWLISGETTFFFRFYAFDYFGYFCVTKEHFLDFLIFRD